MDFSGLKYPTDLKALLLIRSESIVNGINKKLSSKILFQPNGVYRKS